MFYLCTNLGDIERFGENVTSVGDFAFANQKFHYLGFYHTKITSFGRDILRYSGACGGITFPETIRSIAANGAYWSLQFYRIYATTPPSWSVPSSWRVIPTYIYVPDEAVDIYKSATTWSTYESRILPMSQWATDAAAKGWKDVMDGAVR